MGIAVLFVFLYLYKPPPFPPPPPPIVRFPPRFSKRSLNISLLSPQPIPVFLPPSPPPKTKNRKIGSHRRPYRCFVFFSPYQKWGEGGVRGEKGPAKKGDSGSPGMMAAFFFKKKNIKEKCWGYMTENDVLHPDERFLFIKSIDRFPSLPPFSFPIPIFSPHHSVKNHPHLKEKYFLFFYRTLLPRFRGQGGGVRLPSKISQTGDRKSVV